MSLLNGAGSFFVSFLADIGKKQYFCGENMKKTCR